MSTQIRRPVADVNAEPYTLDSVTSCDSPLEDDGRSWHRYIIAQGENRIVGHQPGSVDSVRRGAEEMVVKLNDRRLGTAGRTNIKLGTNRKP